MKPILVLLQISWIGGEEPRYNSTGNYDFGVLLQWGRRVKINHVKRKDAFNAYQDAFTCRALLTKKRRRRDVYRMRIILSVVAGPVERVVSESWAILLPDAALLSQHLLRPKPPLHASGGKTRWLGCCYPGRARTGRFRPCLHVAISSLHFFWTTNALFRRTCLAHAKDISSTPELEWHQEAVAGNNRSRRWKLAVFHISSLTHSCCGVLFCFFLFSYKHRDRVVWFWCGLGRLSLLPGLDLRKMQRLSTALVCQRPDVRYTPPLF